MTSIYVLLVQVILWLKVVSRCSCHQRADCVCQSGIDSHGIAGLWSATSWLSRHCLFFPPYRPLWLCLHIGWRCLIELIAILWIVLSLARPVIVVAAWPGLTRKPLSLLPAVDPDSRSSVELLPEPFMIYELLVDINRHVLASLCHSTQFSLPKCSPGS